MTSDNLFEPLERRRSRLDKFVDQLRGLKVVAQELRQANESYRAFESEVELSNIDRLESAAADLSRRIADQEVNKESLERRLQDIRAAQTKPLAFWKYFSADQKQLRTESDRLGRELSAVNQCLFGDGEALSEARASMYAARKRISEHDDFDLNDSETRLAAIGPEIQRVERDVATTRAELERIEAKIRPHAQELNRLKSELSTLKSDITRADRFDQDLTSAANSYERAMIHQECEVKFGTGSPKQIIGDRRGRVRRLENNIPKLERRIRDELQKLDRKISHLLIDGNNACYEGNSFIGLRGLSALLQELGNRFRITVVFDASIRSMLKKDSQGVERILGPSVATHVAPSKTAADEYLMKLAGKDKGTFILSNDRFAEYHDYDVVKSGRVLRFLIADGKLMANELDVSVSL